MPAEPHLDWIGIMRARLDNLPQRRRSVTLRAAAPDVDFRTLYAARKNSRSPRSVLAQFSVPRLSRQGTGHWHIACGNCGNPRHGPPARYRDRNEGRAERSETHFSGPIAVRKYSWGPLGGKMARPSSSSTARRQFRGSTGIGGRGFYGAHLLKEAVAKPREQSENSQSFQCGKAANPGQWCLLIPAFCVPRF
jgi:hypothetical protein